jgi:thiamine-phosphate pyrophosphorylase
VHADGVHIDGGKAALAEALESFQPKSMVGAGGAKTRDDALALGEMRPDYIFFGRFGYDNKPEPHSRNLSLGRWWAEMIQLPVIVMAGCDIASVEAVAATGADFVALSSAVFGEGVDPREAVARANTILDENAPRFEE